MGDEPLDSGLKQAGQSAFVFCPYLMLSAVLTKGLSLTGVLGTVAGILFEFLGL